VPNGKSVRVQCLRCGHFSVLTPDMLSRLAIAPNTPIAAFVKRLSRFIVMPPVRQLPKSGGTRYLCVAESQ
jgi:hypothetical protein